MSGKETSVIITFLLVFPGLENIKFLVPFPLRKHYVLHALGNKVGNMLFLLKNLVQTSCFEMVSIYEIHRKHIYFCSVSLLLRFFLRGCF